MALEPITRQEQIIAGKDLQPITRMEMFLKQFGGGGGGSVHKPLTYDYMPEGYPSKSVETVTLMEEQEVAFYDKAGGMFGATSPVILDIKLGDNLTVVWDGVSYNVTVKTPEGAPSGTIAFGNLGLAGGGAEEDYPFAYAMIDSVAQWVATDTSPSHTISVKTAEEVITQMSEEFLPAGVGTTAVITYVKSTNTYSSDLTYDELHEILLDHRQVVFWEPEDNVCSYLTKWQKKNRRKH